MNGPLRIVLVEDRVADADLLIRELRKAYPDCQTRRVDAASDLQRALVELSPDIVLSDHSLPQFDARGALAVVQRENPEIPVVIVTGSLNEESAADYIKAGAADYVVKDRLHRLVPAIERALEIRRERAAADHARSRAELRFRTLVEHSSDVITLLDAAGNIEYSTQALRPTLGYAPGEKTGHPVFELIHPDDRPTAAALFRQLLESPGRAFDANVRFQHRDGSWRALEVVGVNRLEDPAIGAVVVNYHDVTERVRAERRLRRTMEFLSQTQAAAHIGSWERDLLTGAVMWSEETYRLFGMDPGTTPRTLEQYVAMVHPEDRQALQTAIAAAVASRSSYDVDHRITWADGSVHYLHGRGGVATDDAGRPSRLLGTFLDITERKRAEAELHQANERLAAVVSSSPLATFATDREGLVQTWNAAAERLFRWQAEEVMGHPLTAALHGVEEEYVAVQHRAAAGEVGAGAEIVWYRRDGTPITGRLFAAPLHGPDGRVNGVLGLVEDLTAIKQLEQQFLQAQKMEAVGRLAGGVAHDFNNLLTVIKGYSTFAMDETPEGDARRQGIEEIQKAADRAAALTRQLLAFSRQQVLAPTVLDLVALVRNTERMLQRIIGEDIGLAVIAATEPVMTKADAGQLEQVLLNLVVNARDAMPTGGSLTIKIDIELLDTSSLGQPAAVEPGQYAMIAVTDTGTGMDAETKARMFEPFFTTKEPGKGTGLGLATAYGIVKQTGGYITVVTSPGSGSTFRVYLPATRDADEMRGPIAQPVDVSGGSESVLLVEDEPAVRQVARRILERAGYTVLAAETPAQAMSMAARSLTGVDLLLTDVVMPDMNGRTLAAELINRLPSLRVLYMSGYPSSGPDSHDVVDWGDHYLQKPFTPGALLGKVREVLRTRTR